jgi:predicted ribosomally synthesized peptide with nif11-like leader
MLKDDAGLVAKLKGAADLDTAIAPAKEAGSDVSEADWLRYQQGMGAGELSDEQLDAVAGGSKAGAKNAFCYPTDSCSGGGWKAK